MCQSGDRSGHRLRLGPVAKTAASVLLLWLVMGSACGEDQATLLPSRRMAAPDDAGARLIVRFVHVADTHVVDAQSPARYPGADAVIDTAWRAWENCSTQILDGTLRAVNRIHASGESIDFLLHTGDLCDNAQGNELGWAITAFDGGLIAPLTGPDDRAPEAIPLPEMDPYAPFTAQGLYRLGIHGPLPSIPWYAALGNHESFGMGVFPIIPQLDGSRLAPLPLPLRVGLLIPTVLDPTGSFTHGPISPAHPGPAPVLELPARVVAVPERRYFDKSEFVQAMFQTATEPAGHGFTAPDAPTWYSTSPVPGLRLITLDTSDVPRAVPSLPYSEGCISAAQLDFLVTELDAAQERGEWVIVASHHPSGRLELLYASVLGPDDFRALLNGYPNVIAHIASHEHRNRVIDRGGYVEIETCGTLDWPQEARLIEIWRGADGSPVVAYRMFSSLDDDLPPLGDDPLRGLRLQAHTLAGLHKGIETAQRSQDSEDLDPQGEPADRDGAWLRTR